MPSYVSSFSLLFKSHRFVAAEKTLSVVKLPLVLHVNKCELNTGKLPLGGLARNSEVKKLTN